MDYFFKIERWHILTMLEKHTHLKTSKKYNTSLKFIKMSKLCTSMLLPLFD